MKATLLPVVLITCTLLILGSIPASVVDYVIIDYDYQPSEIEAAKESIALSLLGQLQLSVGDLMWLKSMEYLHVGIVQRMPTRSEEAQGYRARDSQNVAAGLGHTEGLNMTLDPERDWRGIFGRIERHIKPYSERHIHDDPVELIPWYQLAVRLNPRLERLYTLGAFYLADFASEAGEAREMLEAGLKANPYSFEIHSALGRLFVEYADRLHDLEDNDDHPDDQQNDGEHREINTPEEAYEYAVELLETAINYGVEQRSQMAEKREIFDDFQNQLLGESFLFLSKAYMGLGDYEQAIQTAETGYTLADKYSQRNLLRIQQRTAQRAHDGEAIDEEDLRKLTRAGSTAPQHDEVANNVFYNSLEVVERKKPIAVLLGIHPPEDTSPLIDSPGYRELLADIREYPNEALSVRAGRIGLELNEVIELADDLERHQMILQDELIFTGSLELNVLEDRIYRLTPIGLYIDMALYGFDFWQVMEEEVAVLQAEGDHVALPGREHQTVKNRLPDELNAMFDNTSFGNAENMLRLMNPREKYILMNIMRIYDVSINEFIERIGFKDEIDDTFDMIVNMIENGLLLIKNRDSEDDSTVQKSSILRVSGDTMFLSSYFMPYNMTFNFIEISLKRNNWNVIYAPKIGDTYLDFLASRGDKVIPILIGDGIIEHLSDPLHLQSIIDDVVNAHFEQLCIVVSNMYVVNAHIEEVRQFINSEENIEILLMDTSELLSYFNDIK